ncbi:unnamed protein product, partial [Medioppia subpectinata]
MKVILLAIIILFNTAPNKCQIPNNASVTPVTTQPPLLLTGTPVIPSGSPTPPGSPPVPGISPGSQPAPGSPPVPPPVPGVPPGSQPAPGSSPVIVPPGVGQPVLPPPSFPVLPTLPALPTLPGIPTANGTVPTPTIRPPIPDIFAIIQTFGELFMRFGFEFVRFVDCMGFKWAVDCRSELLQCVKSKKIGNCLAALTCKGLTGKVCTHHLANVTYGGATVAGQAPWRLPGWICHPIYTNREICENINRVRVNGSVTVDTVCVDMDYVDVIDVHKH